MADYITLKFAGDPVPKGRPRMGKGGHVYTPSAVRVAEDAIRWQAIAQGAKVDADHELEVTVIAQCPSRKRVDVDNLAKLVLDALNGVAFADDVQIAALHAYRVMDSREPGTTVIIRPTGPWPMLAKPKATA